MFELMYEKGEKENSELKLLTYIVHIFDRIHFYKPSLPLFDIDWKVNLHLQNIMMIRKGKLLEFLSRYRTKLRRMIISQAKGRFIKEKELDSLDQKTQVHLILEGVSTSN